MSRPITDLLIPPLFYDALSEKFKPPHDEKKRRHSLARLMVRSFEDGESSPARDQEELIIGNNGILTAYRYLPVWAPGVESSAFTREDMRFGQANTLAGLILRDDKHHTLAVSYDIDTMTLSESGIGEVRLAVGSALNDVRKHMAQIAFEFFDAAKPPEL